MFKKFLAYITLITLIFSQESILYAANQTLSAPEPAFVENRIQPENGDLLNRFLIGENMELGTKTYVEQHFSVDVDSIGAFTFKLKRTKALGAGQDPEELHVELYEEGVKLIEDNLEGVSSSTSLQTVKWIFPNGQEVSPNKDLALRISVNNSNPDTEDFPYYIIGDEDFESKPIGITNMVYFNGEQEVVTSNLLNIEILRKPNDTVVINEGSIYKWEPLTSDNSILYNNASDLVVITGNPSYTTIESTCSSLDKGGHEYRSIKEIEAEALIKNSFDFKEILKLVTGEVVPEGNLVGSTYSSTASLELRTPTNIFHFNGLSNTDVKNIRFYKNKNTTPGSTTGFGICVYKENENIFDSKKDLDLEGYDKIKMQGLNLNTERYLVNSSNNQSFINVPSNLGSYNPQTGVIYGDVLDTGVNIKAGTVIKSFLPVKVDNGKYLSDGFYNSNNYRVNALVYKIGINGEWKYVNQYATIQESGDLYLTITDTDSDLSNNTGSFKVILENVINTNSIRENNNLYFNVFKNIKDYKYRIGKTSDGATMDSVLYESPMLPGTKIKVKGLEHLYEHKINNLTSNGITTPIAFNGRYFYTLKGNKLFQIGTGLSETTLNQFTEYTLDKDLTGVNSLVWASGNLYVGYSDKGLSNTISKISLSGTTGTIEPVRVEVPFLSTDYGDINNKKIEKYRYLLNSDGEYIYSLSYLLGDSNSGNNANKDEGYYIRIYDPNSNLALIKDIYIGKKLKQDGSLAKKIGYYTNGFFVDKNYIYIIQDDRTSATAKVVLINKNTFEYEDEFEITQDFSSCSSATTDSNLYACPINGVYDYLNDRVLLADSNSGKLHFYKKMENNLQHVNIPDSVVLDYTDKLEEYLVEYEYDFVDFIKNEIVSLPVSGEEIDYGDKEVTKGFLFKNKNIMVTIGDVVTDKSITPNKQYLLGAGGVYRLVRNKGDSQFIRNGTEGMNSFSLQVGGVDHRFRGDYGTVSRLQDGKYTISGEKDSNGIIPTIEYKLNNENDEFLTGKISFRNEGEKRVEYANGSTSMIFNLIGFEDITDSRGNIKNNIQDVETKWISLNDVDTNDSLLFGIEEGQDALLGMSVGATNLSVILNNLKLNPGESKSYDFYIGSFIDTTSNANSLYSSMINSISTTFPYSFNDTVNVDNKRLNLNVNKSERDITPGSGASYSYPSNSVNITNSFTSTFDNVDGHTNGGIPLVANGFASSNMNISNGEACSTTEGSSGNGKIATLELVKYLPEKQNITFTMKYKTQDENDRINFYVDDKRIIEDLTSTFTTTTNYTFEVDKGLHIFTWKYGKDANGTATGDKMCIDNININKILEVFGSSCGFSGSALFYDNIYQTDFINWSATGSTGNGTGTYPDLDKTNVVSSSYNNGTFYTSKDVSNKAKGPQRVYRVGNHSIDDQSGVNTGIEMKIHNMYSNYNFANFNVSSLTSSLYSYWVADSKGNFNSGYNNWQSNAMPWTLDVYGAGGQIASASQFSRAFINSLVLEVDGYSGKSKKLYYDLASAASGSSEDAVKVYMGSTYNYENETSDGWAVSKTSGIRKENCSSDWSGCNFLKWQNNSTGAYHTDKIHEDGSDLEANVWYTHIRNSPTNTNDININWKYAEVDGGDDGATYLGNVVMKEKAPKDGCNMDPQPYNDKVATHFIFPGFDMQIDNDGTLSNGVVKVIPMFIDTFIEVTKRNQSTGNKINDRIFYGGDKIGKTIDFSVESGYVYEITSNRKVSVLMNNFYQDLPKTGNTIDDNTPTYDIQNGDEFVIYMPGNQEKKGNMYISAFNKNDNTNVVIKDLTNNKTNYSFILGKIGESNANIALDGIGEGQILKINADNPITIYYGLGTKPAISELLSPNAQNWSFPIKMVSSSEYFITMYSYYDLNQAKVYNQSGVTLLNQELSTGQVTSINASNNSDEGTFYSGTSIGPVGLMVGNLPSSYDYLYPIKDATKLYGIGGKYAFSNVSSNKLIIIADKNGGSNVKFNVLEDGNSKVSDKILKPFEKFELEVDTGKFYEIETDNINFNLFVFAQKGENIRNTFQTIFKSRDDDILGTYKIKSSLGDKYVKYDVFGDFDYIVDEPIETGNIDPKTMWHTPSSGSSSPLRIDKNLIEGEKIVFNGYSGMQESNPNDYIIDNISMGKYVNSLDYGTGLDNGLTNTIEPYLGGLVKEVDSSGNKVLAGVGVNNKEGNHNFKFQVIDKGVKTDNGPSYIYKKYNKDTYFPEIARKEVYNFILPTGNQYNVQLQGTSFFGKRNLSTNYFKSKYDNNGKITVNTSSNNDEFVDTYYIPIMINLGGNTYDYLELNNFSTLSFNKSGNKNGLICFTIQDNNKKNKNICYTEYNEGNKISQNLLYPGKFIEATGGITNRNIVSDYSVLYRDGTIPLRILGVEITGYKKGNYNTTFSNINIKNYTDISTEVTFKANTNIYSPNIPLSHRSKIGELTITDTEGSLLFDNDNVTFTNIKDNSKQSKNGANLLLIQDDNLLETHEEESIIAGNSTYTVEEKNNYIVKFRARGEGNKQINISNTTGTKMYVSGVIPANNYSGNIDGSGNDLGEEYLYTFSTDWGDNEDIKLEFINKGGNFYIGDVRITEMKDSLFGVPTGIIGSTDSGEKPVIFPGIKEGNKKTETIWKAVTYINKNNNNAFVSNITTNTSLNNAFTSVQNDIDTNGEANYSKLITFNNDKNVVNFLDGKKLNNYTLSKLTTNLYSDKIDNFKVRMGLVGQLTINGTNVYTNLKTTKTGCIAGTGAYPDYNTNDIVSKTCLVEINLSPGMNEIVFKAISNNNNSTGYEGLYKDWILNPLVIKSGSTNPEKLSFKEDTNIKITPNSFLPFDKNNNLAFDIVGDTIELGRTGENVKIMSMYSVDRDYSIRSLPTIETDRSDRTYYVGDVVKLIQYGNAQYPSSTLTSGTKTTKGSYKNGIPVNGNNFIKFKLPTTVSLSKNDVIETFIKFNTVPEELELNFNSTTDINKDRKIYWGDNYLDSRIDDNLHIKKVGDLDDIVAGKQYRILIPANTLTLASEGITGMYFNTYAGQIEITDVNILKGYSTEFGNNLKLTFDVETGTDTAGRDIIFGVTNNSTDIDTMGYKVVFSESSSSTTLYKNGSMLTTVSNDDSYIQSGINVYNLQFIKSGEKLIVGVKYNYLEDGVTKTKVVKLIEYIETNPLTLKNSNIVFETNNNKYKINNVKVADGEDKEQVGFFHVVMHTADSGAGELIVRNEDGTEDMKIIDIKPDKTDYYINMKNMGSYSKRISDIIFTPNMFIGDSNRKNIKIEKIKLMKETQIPPTLAIQDKTETMGSLKIKNGSKIIQSFVNDKEKIMGIILFLTKDVLSQQPEGLTFKMYPVDTVTGLPDYTNLLVEKTVNTDSITTELSKMKIIFPAISVVEGNEYAYELTTANNQGLNVYGTNVNSYTDGYAYVYQKETPELEGFEFNELGKIIYGTKGTNGIRGDNALTNDHEPNRVEVSGDNIKLVGNKSSGDTITIPHSENLNLSNKFSFIIKGNFPAGNGSGWPLILQKQGLGVLDRNYGVYINKGSKKLHLGFTQVGKTAQTSLVTGTDFADEDVIIGISFDTINGIISIYKNGTLTDQFEIGVPVANAVKVGTGTVSSNWESASEKGRPLVTNTNDLIMMGSHVGWNTPTMELDYVRIYDTVLTASQFTQLSKEVNYYKYRTPYDLAFFMITKDNEIETIEERTYFLDGDMIKEVNGDLYLNGYDAGSGITELFLTGNMTFRVKGNIYVNADRIRVINDNRKTGIDAISYIGFIADKDIIINSNVKDMQGGYFAKGAIKTVFSNEQLKIYGLLAGEEVDLQNRVYMGADPLSATYIPCSATHTENCSFTIEFDNRIYKKMPPLFYKSNNKDGVTIKMD